MEHRGEAFPGRLHRVGRRNAAGLVDVAQHGLLAFLGLSLSRFGDEDALAGPPSRVAQVMAHGGALSSFRCGHYDTRHPRSSGSGERQERRARPLLMSLLFALTTPLAAFSLYLRQL